ncbi:MAG: DNA-3-methyladenine glycosylase 2 family protein [Halobacteria archaeon]|nr:DNA-3-methyladenine glycosylase 2 family protein [Halobacteria archaeon]
MTSDAIQHLRRDEEMRQLIEEHGYISLEPADDIYRRLVVSIINQQLSTASADAIRERVFGEFEITPRGMLNAEDDTLNEMGLSRQKIDYINSISREFVEKEYSRDYFAGMSDDEVIGELTDIHGVGVWTSKMFLIFCLSRRDVFPVEDLGIRNGMERLYGEMERHEMVEKARDWKPYRSIASLYVWRSYD